MQHHFRGCVMEMYVLKNGEMLGPFTEGALIAEIEAGRFTASDLAQRSGTPYWTPLGKIFDPAPPEDAAGSLTVARQRAGDLFDRYFAQRPLRTALVCFGAGFLFFIVSFWPALIWLPWFGAAFVASLLLMRNGDLRRGALICALAAFLPVLLGVLVMGSGGSRLGGDTQFADTAEIPRRSPAPILTQAPPAEPQREFIPDLPVAPTSAPIPEQTRSSAPIAAEPIETDPSDSMAAAAPPKPGGTPVSPEGGSHPPDSKTPGGVSGLKDKLLSLVPGRDAERDRDAPAPPPAELPPLPPVSPPVSPAAPLVSQPPMPDGQAILGIPPPATDKAPDAGAKQPNALDPDSARLVREYRNSLVFVDDATGTTGSGFICQDTDKTYLVTNIHVVAGMRAPKFTRLDRSPLQVGAASAAVAHDILRYEVPPAVAKAHLPLEIMLDVENNAAIGDDVVVLGNSEGAHVIMPLAGKISGLGPNLVEVTAEFVPGNSGSPIVHLKSGKVIGLATYAVKRDMDWLSERTSKEDKAKKIRRFGYRLDSVQTWQPVNWRTFQNDVAEMERVNELTKSLALVLDDIRDDGKITAGRHHNPAIRRQIETFVDTISKRTLSSPDRLRSKQSFLADMRTASQLDLNAAKNRVAYDYFRRSLAEEEKVREQFRTIFDLLMKSQR